MNKESRWIFLSLSNCQKVAIPNPVNTTTPAYTLKTIIVPAKSTHRKVRVRFLEFIKKEKRYRKVSTKMRETA